ncbi:MAG TPA: DNA alkylation repair protein [Candidatus Limnocylindria bacterium]|nr:DNA alkylation repair protein [Candidatus Limnocylindria bacterium]
MDRLADELEATLRRMGTPKRADGEKAYLKSDLDFTGTLVSETRAEVKRVDRELALDHDRLIELVEALWSKPVFERRLAAIMFLQRHPRLLSDADIALLERMARGSRTWALLDYLAVDVLGRMVEADPPTLAPIMDRWATDDDFWICRASLLAELRPIRRGADLDRFLVRADPMLEEREFFIRKAIGWVLREAGKRRPSETAAWLAPRTRRASGVTMREAVKYLPPADADRLMTAYRQRRPARPVAAGYPGTG